MIVVIYFIQWLIVLIVLIPMYICGTLSSVLFADWQYIDKVEELLLYHYKKLFKP